MLDGNEGVACRHVVREAGQGQRVDLCRKDRNYTSQGPIHRYINSRYEGKTGISRMKEEKEMGIKGAMIFIIGKTRYRLIMERVMFLFTTLPFFGPRHALH